MGKPRGSKEILWANVSALMRHHWEGENLSRLAREGKIGPGTATRIKEQRTSVGLEVLDQVAAIWGLQPWQLLLPNLDPGNVPVTMLSEDEKKLYAKLHRMKSVLEEPS